MNKSLDFEYLLNMKEEFEGVDWFLIELSSTFVAFVEL